MDRTQTRRRDGGEVVRMCALTRARRPVGELVRFCLDPEGRVVPDLKNRLPGRGVWLTATHETVARAARKGVFARAFSRSVQSDPALADTVATLLEKDALARLGLANKAGLVTAGFTKVAEALERGRAIVVVHAADAAADGRAKIDAKARNTVCASVDCFNSGQLSLALGRSNVVHAALSQGGACDGFLRAVDRLVRYRAPDAVFTAA